MSINTNEQPAPCRYCGAEFQRLHGAKGGWTQPHRSNCRCHPAGQSAGATVTMGGHEYWVYTDPYSKVHTLIRDGVLPKWTPANEELLATVIHSLLLIQTEAQKGQ